MKNFLKFLITILVISIVTFVVCYFTQNLDVKNGNDGNIEISGETDSGDKEQELPNLSGNDKEIILPNEETISEENVTELNSGEEVSKDDEKDIDEIISELYSGEILTSYTENLSGDMLGEVVYDIMINFNVDSFPATINIRKQCIEIIPFTDFLNNMIYYYDETGKLICYENVSVTVGGNTRYYFENEEIKEIKDSYDELVTINHEIDAEILRRARDLYYKYLSL